MPAHEHGYAVPGADRAALEQQLAAYGVPVAAPGALTRLENIGSGQFWGVHKGTLREYETQQLPRLVVRPRQNKGKRKKEGEGEEEGGGGGGEGERGAPRGI